MLHTQFKTICLELAFFIHIPERPLRSFAYKYAPRYFKRGLYQNVRHDVKTYKIYSVTF